MGRPRITGRDLNWRGNKMLSFHGYILVRVAREHHLADVRGYAYEHRLVAEEKIGRRLVKGEHVHHRDGNTQNNHPDNLEVLTVAQHKAEHRGTFSRLRPIGTENPDVECACGCGGTLKKYDEVSRPRRYLPWHSPKPDTVSRAVAAALANGPSQYRDLPSMTGLKHSAVAGALLRLKSLGIAMQQKRGVWMLAPKTGDQHE